VKRSARTVENISLGPARPPISGVIIIVVQSAEISAICVCALKGDFNRPAGVIDSSDVGTETVFPVAVALSGIPVHEPVERVHLMSLLAQHQRRQTPLAGVWDVGLRTFAPREIIHVMEIVLDGYDWRTELDFIEAVIAGVEGPQWHGRNYNALYDSLVVGSINGVDGPYDFVIKPPTQAIPEVTEAISYFLQRVSDWRAEGANISARIAAP
jgi:hypothetical protein